MDVARLASALIQIRSENPPGGSTADVVAFIGEFLDSLGVKNRIISHPGGRENLVTTGGAGSRLLLCGHVDVVPPPSPPTTGRTTPPIAGRLPTVTSGEEAPPI
ncbi:hypothetical protein [Methanoculleus chikugoensis]|uniref:hypothetical protein n=1 Tax=Methanoculleus chikugoensis TaxID=118126 RepID=UPI000B1A111B|nr:hypothetical protein [Methanoculleus chikugoensis]